MAGVSLLLGCGGGSGGPGSTIATAGGSGGGNAGMAGGLSLGDQSGGAGAGGAAGTTVTAGGPSIGGTDMSEVDPPTVQLHTCPATPDPPCPSKMVSGDVRVDDAAGAAALQGVTSIEGRLSISTEEGLDALSCLESVGDDLEIDLFGSRGDASLWGLRNLKTIGGSIDVSDSFGRVYADCGFARLEKLGEKYITGGAVDCTSGFAGELDLSSLKVVRHIRLKNSELTRVKLPNGVSMLEMGQLAFDSNPVLSEVTGFSGVTIKMSNIVVSGTYSVRIVKNPKLSDCRAHELAALFSAAGYSEASFTISDNAPCTM